MEAIHPKYKTFWRRFAASIIDVLVLLPILIIQVVIFGDTRTGISELTAFVIWFVSYGSYSVILTGLHGGTPGKKAMGLLVLDGDDEQSYIGLARAFKRDSPLLIADVLAIIYMVAVLDNNPYGFDNNDPVIRGINSLSGVWGIAELITMLGNERRRAIHDILANSVVVNKLKLDTEPNVQSEIETDGNN